MTGRAAPLPRALLLGAAFLVVHLGLSILNFTGPNQPAGDVTGVYRFWIDYWRDTGVLVGVDTAWVYPIVALVPMLAAAAFGDGPYLTTWLALVTVLDAVALILLARRSVPVAWWWLAFTALLGPVALSRLDAIACAIAVVAVLHLARRPAVAAVLLTIGAWVKVWPAALLAAAVVAQRRVSTLVAAAALTCAAVIGAALVLGAGPTVFSFIGTQAARGVQVEAPVALPWLWSAAFGDTGTGVYYDTEILTYQLRGQGVAAAASAMTPVLAVGVLAVTVLALLARRRGAPAGELLAITGLGYVAAIIALNKVGSPQYLTWYVAPIVLGLLVAASRFRVPAVLALVASGLTQLVYPWFYGDVIGTQPLMIAVLTVRNVLELALLVWSLLALRSLRPEEPLPIVLPAPVPTARGAGRGAGA